MTARSPFFASASALASAAGAQEMYFNRTVSFAAPQILGEGQDTSAQVDLPRTADELQPAPLGSELPVVGKEEVRDLAPTLRQLGGSVQDRVGGLAVMPVGTA